ncbi:MAG TPA: hypothetical protein PKY96_09080 [Flavobacteriales bacterium]|nr:hypothetical protein [Flavobacteriales bacterium]
MRPLLFTSLVVASLLCCCCGQKKTTGNAPNPVQQEPHGGKGERHEAPAHSAPDQDRIDSLKQEKLKKKNP